MSGLFRRPRQLICFPQENETLAEKITDFQWDHSLNATSSTFPRFGVPLHLHLVTLSKKTGGWD